MLLPRVKEVMGGGEGAQKMGRGGGGFFEAVTVFLRVKWRSGVVRNEPPPGGGGGYETGTNVRAGGAILSSRSCRAPAVRRREARRTGPHVEVLVLVLVLHVWMWRANNKTYQDVRSSLGERRSEVSVLHVL